MTRIVAGLALAYLLVPIVALMTRVDPALIPEVISDPETSRLVLLTVAAALQATVIATVLGVALAIRLTTFASAAGVVRLLVLLPLAMPPVVGGLALSASIGNSGLLSPILEAAHLSFAFSFQGVVAAHVFVSLPFVVVSVDQALRQLDHDVVFSAEAVGIAPRRVILPAIAPSIITGAGLAFARSLGEFGTTLTFAGSLPDVTRTMPIAIYLEREVAPERAYILSAILIALAIGALAVTAIPFRRRFIPRPIELTEPTRLPVTSLPAPWGNIPAGTHAVVIGPNGAGKSTLIKDQVTLPQRAKLPQTTTARGAVAMVTDRPDDFLSAAGLSQLSDVPVPHLSGGQEAQIALLRAVAAQPPVLLLDEPFSALDITAATRWRRLIRSTGLTTVMVTHDGLDVALAEWVVVVDKHTVVASGPAAEILRRPPTDYAAKLAGLNRLEGTAVSADGSDVRVRVGRQELVCVGDVEVGDRVVIVCDPTAVALRLPRIKTDEVSSPRNIIPAYVVELSATDASHCMVRVHFDDGDLTVPVTAAAVRELGLENATNVECVVKAHAFTVYSQF